MNTLINFKERRLGFLSNTLMFNSSLNIKYTEHLITLLKQFRKTNYI